MRGGRRDCWTEDERLALMQQREAGVAVVHLKIPTRSNHACIQEYYRLKNPLSRPTARRKARHDVPLAPDAATAASLAAPVKRPRYFSDADRFVLDRIKRQGLTAGVLGDPLPGRSALDKRGGT